MSRTNPKQEISFLREQFQSSLEKIGFIRDILIDEDQILEIVEARSPGLKKVTITQLSDSQTIDRIWEINLEYKNDDYPGLSTGDSTPEKAILILQKRINQNGDISDYHLSIILVELKASLQPRKLKKDKDSTLQQIYRKFQCAMNRMYMLLSINNHRSPRKPYQDKSIYVKFQGLIFYNRNEIKDGDVPSADNNRYDLNESNLYDILTNPTRSETLTVNTLLEERDKIKIKFIPNPKPDQDHMTIPLKDLLDR